MPRVGTSVKCLHGIQRLTDESIQRLFLFKRESCRLEKLAAVVPVKSRVCPSKYNLRECSSGVQVVGKINPALGNREV